MTTSASSKTSKQPKQKKKPEAGASSPSSPTSAPSGESTRRPLSQLKANPKNPRLPFTDAQTEAFKRSLAEYGDLSGIVENQRTGHLVGGHKRCEQFANDPNAYAITTHRLDQPDASGTLAYGYVETGGTRFAYRLVNWPVEKEKAANLAANQFGAEFDWPAVTEMMRELDGKIDLSLTGFDADELNTLLKNDNFDASKLSDAPKDSDAVDQAYIIYLSFRSRADLMDALLRLSGGVRKSLPDGGKYAHLDCESPANAEGSENVIERIKRLIPNA